MEKLHSSRWHWLKTFLQFSSRFRGHNLGTWSRRHGWCKTIDKRGQKNEENNQNNRFLRRCSIVTCPVSSTPRSHILHPWVMDLYSISYWYLFVLSHNFFFIFNLKRIIFTPNLCKKYKSPCLFERKQAFISLSSLAWGKSRVVYKLALVYVLMT